MSNKPDPTRAELVRTRRRQQVQKRPKQNSALATRSIPPVVSRTAMSDFTQQRATPAPTNRRFQAAFSMAGFELRMPAVRLPRVEVGSRLLSLFLCLLLGTRFPRHKCAGLWQPAAQRGGDQLGAECIGTGHLYTYAYRSGDPPAPQLPRTDICQRDPGPA